MNCQFRFASSKLKGVGKSVERFLLEEDGTTAIEYAVMAALIAATCVAAVSTLANATNASFTDSVTAINN